MAKKLHLTILGLLLLLCAGAKAQTEANFNDAVAEGSLPLTFTNDRVYPWTLVDGRLQSTCMKEYNKASRVSFTFSSEHKTVVSFTWVNYYTYSHWLQVYADGQYQGQTASSSTLNHSFTLEPGQHTVTLVDTIDLYNHISQYGQVWNIKVKEILPLEGGVLTDKSDPITFTNDGAYPWTVEDGYIQNGNHGKQNTVSRMSTKFTITEPKKFSFDRYVHRNDYSTSSNYYHYYKFLINGELHSSCGNQTSWQHTSMMLQPGTYTMEWVDSMASGSSTPCFTKLRNMELSSHWVEVDVTTPGSLGVEALYLVDVLDDIELLRVRGTINSADWATIKQMRKIVALDLSGASASSVPNNAFDGLSRLYEVKLPANAASIGQYAFRNTQIHSIDIPAAVTSIGQYAFTSTPLAKITFAEGSQLKTIGYRAFEYCSDLEELTMPNTVTELQPYQNNYNNDASTFYECTSLRKLHFSDALVTIGGNMCYECNSLEDVKLPKNLNIIRSNAFTRTSSLRGIDFPENLKTIYDNAFYESGLDSVKLPIGLTSLGNYAFRYCRSLKYVELPSYISSYYYNFRDCPAINKVVCRSATPPNVEADPFDDGPSKGSVTLVVPSFAVVNYKLDSYWYQFGSIVEGDDVGYWKITSALALTNNRRMDGKPDIDLCYGGLLTVGGNAPMETARMNFYVSESNPGRLLNDCPDFTADSLKTIFSVNEDRWYFITPMHDVALSDVSHSAGASYVFRHYDGASRATNGTGASWKNVETDTLKAGVGYIFQCNNDGELILPADTKAQAAVFATTDVTTTLAAHDATSAANAGWNYVGNPYPAYFDIYYMDFTAPITVWTGSTYRAYSIVDDEFALRPMQAFFVQKPDAVDEIVFRKEGRQLTSEIAHAAQAPARAPMKVTRSLFDVAITDGTLTDQTRVVVNESASMGYEIECDAAKFMSIDESAPQILTTDADGNAYAISERPQADGTVSIGYSAPRAGFYTISAPRADGTISLRDNLLGATASLNDGDYEFYSGATDGIDNTRFTLIITAATNSPTCIDGTAATAQATVSGAKGFVSVTAAAGTPVSIYTADGRTAFNGTATGTAMRIDLPAGVYVVATGGQSLKAIVY